MMSGARGEERCRGMSDALCNDRMERFRAEAIRADRYVNVC